MTRAKRIRLVCGLLAILFLATAAGRTVMSLSAIADPALTTVHVQCRWPRCSLQTDPARLLTEYQRQASAQRPHDPARLLALLDDPSAHAWLAFAAALRGLSLALLYLFLGLAFRQFARDLARDGRAIAWVRRSAAAAFAAVLLAPVADSIRATALSPAVTGQAHIYFEINANTLFFGILLAGAAWVAARVLEQGWLARTQLAEIV